MVNESVGFGVFTGRFDEWRTVKARRVIASIIGYELDEGNFFGVSH